MFFQASIYVVLIVYSVERKEIRCGKQINCGDFLCAQVFIFISMFSMSTIRRFLSLCFAPTFFSHPNFTIDVSCFSLSFRHTCNRRGGERYEVKTLAKLLCVRCQRRLNILVGGVGFVVPERSGERVSGNR